MYRRSDEIGGSKQLALRIAIFGGVAFAILAALFFRLWLLQIVGGEEYLAEARNNRTREFRDTAPRGEILDRDGKMLVYNRTSLALQVNPRKLPPDPAWLMWSSSRVVFPASRGTMIRSLPPPPLSVPPGPNCSWSR